MKSKILVPVDDSAYSKKALERALSIAQITRASVTAVHVMETLPTVHVESQKVLDDVRVKYMRESTKLLDECKVIAEKNDGIKIETVLMEGDDSAESIVEFSEKGGFDMIIIGSRGRSKLEMMLGSTSRKVLHLAKCSVLVVK